MSADEHALAELTDPDGRSVVLLARIWEDKITSDHPELRPHLEQVLVTEPDLAEPDPRARRRRYYRRRVGPSRWLPVARTSPPRSRSHGEAALFGGVVSPRQGSVGTTRRRKRVWGRSAMRLRVSM
ncbi:MAG: hypothetical protein ACRDLD_12730 [Thermoleophilaceae bacterium]